MGLFDVCSSIPNFICYPLFLERFIHVLMCTTNSFIFFCVPTAVHPFFTTVYYSIVGLHHNLFTHFMVGGLGYSQWLAVLNKVSLNTLIHYFGGHKPYSFLLRIKLDNRIPILQNGLYCRMGIFLALGKYSLAVFLNGCSLDILQ